MALAEDGADSVRLVAVQVALAGLVQVAQVAQVALAALVVAQVVQVDLEADGVDLGHLDRARSFLRFSRSNWN